MTSNNWIHSLCGDIGLGMHICCGPRASVACGRTPGQRALLLGFRLWAGAGAPQLRCLPPLLPVLTITAGKAAAPSGMHAAAHTEQHLRSKQPKNPNSLGPCEEPMGDSHPEIVGPWSDLWETQTSEA
eukprot:10997-Chlamydomonas_euryale.AAC.1